MDKFFRKLWRMAYAEPWAFSAMVRHALKGGAFIVPTRTVDVKHQAIEFKNGSTIYIASAPGRADLEGGEFVIVDQG